VNTKIDLESPPYELSPDLMLVMVVQLWKQLLAHDEILGARNLLSGVPWQIRDRDEIREMRKMVDGMLAHVDDPAVMAKIYESYGANEACAVTDAIPDHWSQIPRWKFALDSVQSYHASPRVLDIATSDGWIANRLGMMTNAEVYGLDISAAAITLARLRAEEHSSRARFARRAFGDEPLPADWPKDYNVILLFEVYEHVADSKKLVQEAAKLLAPAGELLITCPRGAWCMGHQVSFHEKWNEVKREHIRAPTIGDIVDDCLDAGLLVVSAVEVPMPMPDVPGQAAILVKALRKVEI
jgi:SAM-dependent methyltransferase